MRVLAAALVAAGALLGRADDALACSCVPFRSAAEQLAEADLVFKGRVLGSASTPRGGARTTFAVVEVLKGPRARGVTVHHQVVDATCGVTYRRGATVWVLADRGPDGRWRTGLCMVPRFPEAELRRAARGQSVPTLPPTY